MSRRKLARDELAIERAYAGLSADLAALPPERRALLPDNLERAAGREEREDMTKKQSPPTAKKAITDDNQTISSKGARIKIVDTPKGSRAVVDKQVIGVKMGHDLVAAIDRAAEQIGGERPDMDVTRADAIRVLLVEALTARKIPLR